MSARQPQSASGRTATSMSGGQTGCRTASASIMLRISLALLASFGNMGLEPGFVGRDSGLSGVWDLSRNQVMFTPSMCWAGALKHSQSPMGRGHCGDLVNRRLLRPEVYPIRIWLCGTLSYQNARRSDASWPFARSNGAWGGRESACSRPAY